VKRLATPVWLTVISAGRPQNVRHMHSLVGAATWYVPEDQHPEYQDAINQTGGMSELAKGSDSNVTHARNRALEDAFNRGLPCVQLDDDMKWIKQVIFTEEENKAVHASPEHAIQDITKRLTRSGFKLAGTAPTNNPYFTRADETHRTFCRSPLWVVLPNRLRLDPLLLVKFDYDYTLQHIREYGGVCRVDRYITEFDYGTQKGGHVNSRTLETQEDAIAYLEGKWGRRLIKRNPRRPGEILLRVPRPQREVLT
jgi:hypothetical protein